MARHPTHTHRGNRSRPGRHCAALAALAALLVAPAPVLAGGPTDHVRAAFVEANTTLTNPSVQESPKERAAALLRLAHSLFAFDASAEVALGPAWQARTAAERDEFVRLFSNLLARSFIARLVPTLDERGGIDVRYHGEDVDGPVATVATSIVGRDGLPLPVDYRMVERQDRWAARDVVLDGSSTVTRYQRAFASMLAQGSYRDLVALMWARVLEAPALPKAIAAGASIRAPDLDLVASADKPARTSETGADAGAGPSRDLAVRETPEPLVEHAVPTEPAASTAQAVTYWVQVGAFRNQGAAARLAAQLRQQQLAVRVERADGTGTSGETFFRVLVGPLSDRMTANARVQDLQGRGYAPFVVVKAR
jgi:phospholipid transport system substrate-binding protein